MKATHTEIATATSAIVYHPIVGDLVQLIATNHWEDIFKQAIQKAHGMNVLFLDKVRNLDEYLAWINAFLYWVPTENSSGQNVNDHLSAFYFIADQAPLWSLQNKVLPSDKALPLTAFSQWLVDYADAMGLFLDSPTIL